MTLIFYVWGNFTQRKKTEMVIFKSKQKKFEGDLKIKLCSWSLYPAGSVKYLIVKIDTNLNGNVFLMVFWLNWIEQMLSCSKWENMLVLKY